MWVLILLVTISVKIKETSFVLVELFNLNFSLGRVARSTYFLLSFWVNFRKIKQKRDIGVEN